MRLAAASGLAHIYIVGKCAERVSGDEKHMLWRKREYATLQTQVWVVQQLKTPILYGTTARELPLAELN